jgi:phospholipase C
MVVIFQENVSFDHYFGTYPVATTTSGEPSRGQRPSTPVNGLTGPLLADNPANLHDVLTCDQGHGYTTEQRAFDGGLMANRSPRLR